MADPEGRAETPVRGTLKICRAGLFLKPASTLDFFLALQLGKEMEKPLFEYKESQKKIRKEVRVSATEKMALLA